MPKEFINTPPMMDLQYFICVTTFDELRAINFESHELGLVEKMVLFEIPTSLAEIRVLRKIVFEDIIFFMNAIPSEFYAPPPPPPAPPAYRPSQPRMQALPNYEDIMRQFPRILPRAPLTPEEFVFSDTMRPDDAFN